MFKKLDNWPTKIVHVYINGKKIKANNGESVAATLLENNISFFKNNEVSNEKRSASFLVEPINSNFSGKT